MGGVRLVDLKGTLIESSGAMIGGSMQKTSLNFTDFDRTNLEKITNELQKALSNYDSLSEKIMIIKKEIPELENQLGQIRTESDKIIQIKEVILENEGKQKIVMI